MKARNLTYDDYLTYWQRRVHELWRGLEQDAARPMRFGLERVPKYRWVDGAQRSIREYLTSAWNIGARACGINPDAESTPEEKRQLQEILDTQSQRDWLNRFYDDIKAAFNQGLVEESMQYRVNMWANRWNEVYNRARAIFCADKKAKWILGETHEHCRTCFGFNGRVYRYSTWRENNALPQTHALECEGYNCLCRLEDTDERITPGRFPVSLLKR